MAVYKVLQDVEAEDKLLGPLTLKGFIYTLIAGFLAFINFKVLVSTELGLLRWLLILFFGLPMLLFAVLASPLGREQPTEVWLLSRIRFLLKPKRRIWNQAGISQLVTITAPKKIERVLTKNISQSEVQSRLKSLALSMDMPGMQIEDSDRLVGAPNKPRPQTDTRPDDDILDEQHNPTARHFWDLLRLKDAERKDKTHARIKAIRTISPPTKLTRKRGKPAYHLAENEAELSQKFVRAEAAFRTKFGQSSGQTAVTGVTQADKLELAHSGNDLSVASIASLANRQPEAKQIGPDELVISLH